MTMEIELYPYWKKKVNAVYFKEKNYYKKNKKKL